MPGPALCRGGMVRVDITYVPCGDSNLRRFESGDKMDECSSSPREIMNGCEGRPLDMFRGCGEDKERLLSIGR